MSTIGNYFHNIKDNFSLKHYVFYIFLIAAITICAVLGVTDVFARSTRILMENIGISIIAVLSLSLVVGFLGELSLGHAAFMSLGAFFGTMLSNVAWPDLTKNLPVLSLILSMIVGAIIAGLFGFVIGLPALRLKGDYLAIVTLAFGEIVKTIFQNLDFFGGAIGFQNKYRMDNSYLFIIVFIIAFLMIVMIKNLIRSKHGRAIMSVRDNEIAARAMGIDSSFYKIFVFVLSAAMAGVAGVLFGASKNVIQASNFNYNYSINNILIIVILGGMGNIEGSVIAAIVVTFIDTKLQTVLSGDLAATKNIFYAAILIFVILYRNATIFKNFREKYSFGKIVFNLKRWLYKALFKKEYVPNPAERKYYSADWTKVPTKIEMNEVLSTKVVDVKNVSEEIKDGE